MSLVNGKIKIKIFFDKIYIFNRKGLPAQVI